MNPKGKKHRSPFRFILPVTILIGIFLTLAGRSDPKGEEATYTGLQTCVNSGCHADYRNETYQGKEQFLQTMHANTHRPPSSESILIDRWFRSDTTLRSRDPRVKTGNNEIVVRLHHDQSAGYLAKLVLAADSTDWMKIAYVFGGNGWLQRYLTEIDGSRYVLPFQYVLPGYRNRSGSGEVRFLDLNNWIAYDSLADRLHLRTTYDRTFVTASWDNACVGCHVGPFALKEGVQRDSGAHIAVWPGADGGDSTLHDLNISIGCESCHGPGSLHVADPTNREHQQRLSPKMWNPVEGPRYLTDRKLDLCTQCHSTHSSSNGAHPYAYSDAKKSSYVAGFELRDFIRDPVADGRYWGDGMTAREHHQTGQDYVRSEHYKGAIFPNGCYDCHDPHRNTEQPYMLNRNWYTLDKGEGCVAFGCHTAFSNIEKRNGQDYNIHSKHLQQHSQCVNCHYTKVATFGLTGQNEFSDHSDFVLRPSATIGLRDAAPGGMPNTCAISCHRNGYGDRNRPDAFLDLIEGEAMRAPDFGITDTNLMLWNEPSDIALADSLWEGFKRLYPQFVMSVRSGEAAGERASITSLWPNPAHDNAVINYTLPQAAVIRLAIYDAAGKIVRVIADARHGKGTYTDNWDCGDERHAIVPSGVYFVRLTGETFSDVRTIVVSR